MPDPIILVTGASGFVGRMLLPMISGAVRATVRTHVSIPLCCEVVVVGDINEHTDWVIALRNIECVVHLAAHVHVLRPTAEDTSKFYQTNVLGTAKLASIAASMGVKRFIFLSSIKVNGEETSSRPFTATDVPCPKDVYGQSKWQAEKKLFEIAANSGMEVVAIRAPLVYGPGVRANFLKLMKWIESGYPLPFGTVENQRSMVSVWNLCDLIKKMIAAQSLESGVVTVSDGMDLSTPSLVHRLARAMGRRALLLPIPLGVLRAAARLTGKTAELTRLCQSLTVDITDTKNRLDWTPPMSVEESLQRTVNWYLQETHNNDR